MYQKLYLDCKVGLLAVSTLLLVTLGTTIVLKIKQLEINKNTELNVCGHWNLTFP